MVGMMQQMGALPIVGPGAVAAGGDPTWGPTASSSAARRGSPEENRAILRALRRGARERRRRGGRRELVDAGRVRRSQPRLGHERASTRCSRRSARSGARCPTSATSVDTTSMVCEGDQVAGALDRPRHAHRRARSSAPSRPGNELVWTHSDFVRLADGKIVERWTATDMLTLFQQAGVLPRRMSRRRIRRERSFVARRQLASRAAAARSSPELHEAERGDPWRTPKTSRSKTRRTSGTGSSPPTTRPRSRTRRSSRATSTRRT